MKKRNCRMTGEEKNVHERAVKLRKMTDDKLVEHIDHIREEQIALLNQQFTPEKSKESADTAPGIGLQNVYDRLYLYYGNRVEMRIQNHAPAGVCIQILLKNEVTT